MVFFGKSSAGQEVSFDIIAEMIHVTHTLTRDSIKRYYEAKFGECDDQKLDKVLSKFDKRENSGTWYELNSKQAMKFISGKAVVRSSINKREIIDIGFKPIKDEVKTWVEDIIRTMPDDAKLTDFEYLIKHAKGRPDFNHIYNVYHPLYLVFSIAVAEIVADCLIAGNKAAISFATTRNLKFLFKLNQNQEYFYCAFAVRALNYRSFAENKDKYKPITKEACLEAAKTCNLFKQEPNKDAIANLILKANTFAFSDGGHIWKDWDSMMNEIDIAVDAVCFHTWKKLCDIYEEDANELDEIIDMLTDYFDSIR